ncbi:MAG: hypothetical protein JXB48_01985 [Candidatus Latescibacteria bacterium]|nr:hypothetical protein [Candidatus Latescibacterota bacterium]
MDYNVNLKELEKKVWQSTFEDGFFDIMFGMLLMLFSVASVIREMIGLWYILIMILFPGLLGSLLTYYGKKIIAAPRIGIAKFGTEHKTALKKSLGLSIISLIVFAILIILTATGKFTEVTGVDIKGFIVPLSIAVGAVVLLSFKAHLLGIPHLTIYGFVIGFGILAVEILRNIIGDPWHYMISFGVPGLFILFYGIRSLVTFTRKYPLPSEGGDL